MKTPHQTSWKEDIEILRDEFEVLFPKDEEAERGERPSKSNRSAGLVLWASWKVILQKAVMEREEEILKEMKGIIERKYFCLDKEVEIKSN